MCARDLVIHFEHIHESKLHIFCVMFFLYWLVDTHSLTILYGIVHVHMTKKKHIKTGHILDVVLFISAQWSAYYDHVSSSLSKYCILPIRSWSYKWFFAIYSALNKYIFSTTDVYCWCFFVSRAPMPYSLQNIPRNRKNKIKTKQKEEARKKWNIFIINHGMMIQNRWMFSSWMCKNKTKIA